MDAYVFLQTAAGKALRVMEELVVSKVAVRAVAVTGRYDVIARIDDVSRRDLAVLLCDRLGAVDGVRSSMTSLVVPTDLLGLAVPAPPIPFGRDPDEELMAVGMLTIAAGSGRSVVEALAPNVAGLALLTGEHDVLFEVGAVDLPDLARTVLEHVHTIPGVTATSTSLVLAATPG